MSIFCVTPNPAEDLTLDVDNLTLGTTQRISSAQRVLGGKGMNVASIAAQQGYQVCAIAPVPAGTTAPRGLRFQPVITQTPLRQTFAIYDRHAGDTVIINEIGSPQPDKIYHSLIDAVVSSLGSSRTGGVPHGSNCAVGDARAADVVTLSGSLPPESPEWFVPDFISAVHSTGTQVIVDTSGAALQTAVAAGADVVKPNLDELEAVTGTRNPLEGARRLGAPLSIVSAGKDGLYAVEKESGTSFHACISTPLIGNPTGAGDAAVAAVASALVDHLSLSELIERAVAWSAAAVMQPTAGTIGTVPHFDITVKELS